MSESGIVEIEKKVFPGFYMFFVDVVLFLVAIAAFIAGALNAHDGGSVMSTASIIGGIALFVVWCFFTPGFFVLQPNEAAALILFGEYKGSVRKSGWHWANPFFIKRKISMRTRNLNGEKLKVNDEMGNPIEIAAVVVWKVNDTAKALFDVENYMDYVRVQSESSLRHLAGLYPYDITEDHQEVSLRGSANEVSEALKNELQQTLDKAGVIIEAARLSHLAYAPEIAAAMLQRQQATAIIAARQKIVEGAVGMVQMALNKLNEKDIIQLDEERKAAMISNLLVVLCGERAAQPIVNTGTLYT
ncbi:MAG: SPFH domain-containing protein [Bacillota bacterium]|nr:SPFH domain-containing protein [Bacillota bacterium]